VLSEYFPAAKLDASFIVDNRIEEIILQETFIENDSTFYSKPALVYRYDLLGKRIHTETNSWSKNGGARRYSDDYGDSTRSVQHEHYVRPDSSISDSKFCQNNYRIDDTLTRIVRKRYLNDSLVTTEDYIVDSRAALRERQKAQEVIPDPRFVDPFSRVIVYEGKQSERIIVEDHPFSPPNPKPKIIKDSLGREIEFLSSIYVEIGGRRILVPSQSIVLTYFEKTSILKSCSAYRHYDREKYKAIVEENEAKNSLPQFPTCYLPECRFYELKAENVELGIPKKVSVTKDKGTSRTIYTTTIRYWE